MVIETEITRQSPLTNERMELKLSEELSETELELVDTVAGLLQDPIAGGAFSIALLEKLGDSQGAEFINAHFIDRMSI